MCVRTVAHSMQWLLALLGSGERLSRHFTLAARKPTHPVVIRMDASPFGMSGIVLATSSFLVRRHLGARL